MHVLLARDLDSAEAEIGASVPAELPDQLDGFLQFRIADLRTRPPSRGSAGRSLSP